MKYSYKFIFYSAKKLKQTQNGMEEEGMLLLQAFTTIWHNDIKVVWKENWYDKEGELFRQENRFW